MNEFEKPSESSFLCMQCGLCCDGTLFKRVPIFAEDAPANLKHVGGVGEDGGGFSLPCRALRNSICTVYSRRPHACVKYKCKLLVKLAHGAFSFVEAAKIIANTVEHKTRVKAKFLDMIGERDGALTVLYQKMQSSIPVTPDNRPRISGLGGPTGTPQQVFQEKA